MRVGVLGINHKLADLKLRESLAKACQKWFGALQAVHENHYFILLSTCNRTEIYFSSTDLAATHVYLLSILRLEVIVEFDHKLYSYFGIDCFCHLARVTLGLDSAIIAETEIQGQVKMAYENTANCHGLPQDLHFLFQKSLQITKKVRSELKLGRGMPNLEHAILQIGKNNFEKPESMRLLFIGASSINEKVLQFLKNKNFQNMTICNRSDLHAEALAKLYHLQSIKWAEFQKWQDYDWIIFGTKSSEYLIKQKDIEKPFLNKKLIMDLCVPRNVEPELKNNDSIHLLNIDEINDLLKIRHGHLNHSLIEAENRIIKATHQLTKKYTEKTNIKKNLLAITA